MTSNTFYFNSGTQPFHIAKENILIMKIATLYTQIITSKDLIQVLIFSS